MSCSLRSLCIVVVLAVFSVLVSAQAPTGTAARNITLPTQTTSLVTSSSNVAASSSSSSAAAAGSSSGSAVATNSARPTGNNTVAANATSANGNATSSSTSTSSTSSTKPFATFSAQTQLAPGPATAGGGKVAQSPDDSYIASAERTALVGLAGILSFVVSLAYITL